MAELETAGGNEPRLSYVVGRLDRALRQELDRRLAPFGLTLPQYTALSVIAHTSGLSNAQLARRTYVTPQSMIEVTRMLEGHGWIERAQSPDHARVKEISLTRNGRRKLDACDKVVDSMEREMLAGIPSDKRREQLTTDLISCVRALHAGLDDQRE